MWRIDIQFGLLDTGWARAAERGTCHRGWKLFLQPNQLEISFCPAHRTYPKKKLVKENFDLLKSFLKEDVYYLVQKISYSRSDETFDKTFLSRYVWTSNSKGHINQTDIEVGKSPSIFCTIAPAPVSLCDVAWIQGKYIDDPNGLISNWHHLINAMHGTFPFSSKPHVESTILNECISK